MHLASVIESHRHGMLIALLRTWKAQLAGEPMLGDHNADDFRPALEAPLYRRPQVRFVGGALPNGARHPRGDAVAQVSTLTMLTTIGS